ncbi:MAG TPA: methyltransferase domain-containing protein [Kofleriaceae bacterium]|nr:methyltransferase domain-containing protein [Kofleriaceae bacterium]
MTAWWNTFFDDEYADFGLTTTSDAARAARDALLDRLTARLHVAPGDTIFDQCCGIGRLALPLAERGFRVIGVDLAPTYAARAQREADRRSLPCELHAGDAFEFRAPRPCDAAINWFTSFGYDEDDRQNARMLERVFESLRPGGSFALDLINLPRVIREFREAAVSRHAASGGELILIQEPRINWRRGMIEATWTFIHPDGRRAQRRVENRVFMPHELIRLLAGVGFVDIEACGADGEPFEAASKRLVMYARKPD